MRLVHNRLTRWANLHRLFDRGLIAGKSWPRCTPGTAANPSNPLRTFVDSRTTGHGVWKWDHYLDAYDRHFSRFRGQEVHILEIGVYAGGSLDMWRDYFGPRCHIYGVDIEPACLAYESDGVKIFIGDQADRSFWKSFRSSVPRLDIAIDDGGHRTKQKIATLEEVLPHLQPGGVYACKDSHGLEHGFNGYLSALSIHLNAADNWADFFNGNPSVCQVTAFQAAISSIHLYPFLAIIERNAVPLAQLRSVRRGTEWQPGRT